MHPSAYQFATTALTAADVAGKRVVEAGALDVNGSARPSIEALGPESYLGTDMRDGPRVDKVCLAEDLPFALGTGYAGVVVTTEMLEHAPDWAAAVRGMVLVLAPGGLLLLTTRGPGFPVHGYPDDHWRFTVDAMRQILETCGLDVLRCEPDPDPASPGVFALARRPPGWKRPDAWTAALAAVPVGVP
jgi:SAM-dependent methyltransferase